MLAAAAGGNQPPSDGGDNGRKHGGGHYSLRSLEKKNTTTQKRLVVVKGKRTFVWFSMTEKRYRVNWVWGTVKRRSFRHVGVRVLVVKKESTSTGGMKGKQVSTKGPVLKKHGATKGPIMDKRTAGGIVIRESGGEANRRHTKADVNGKREGKKIALEDSHSDSDSDPPVKKKDYASTSSQHPPLGGRAEPIHPSEEDAPAVHAIMGGTSDANDPIHPCAEDEPMVEERAGNSSDVVVTLELEELEVAQIMVFDLATSMGPKRRRL